MHWTDVIEIHVFPIDTGQAQTAHSSGSVLRDVFSFETSFSIKASHLEAVK